MARGAGVAAPGGAGLTSVDSGAVSQDAAEQFYLSDGTTRGNVDEEVELLRSLYPGLRRLAGACGPIDVEPEEPRAPEHSRSAHRAGRFRSVRGVGRRLLLVRLPGGCADRRRHGPVRLGLGAARRHSGLRGPGRRRAAPPADARRRHHGVASSDHRRELRAASLNRQRPRCRRHPPFWLPISGSGP